MFALTEQSSRNSYARRPDLSFISTDVVCSLTVSMSLFGASAKETFCQALPARRSFFPTVVGADGRLSKSAASTPRPRASLSTTSMLAA